MSPPGAAAPRSSKRRGLLARVSSSKSGEPPAPAPLPLVAAAGTGRRAGGRALGARGVRPGARRAPAGLLPACSLVLEAASVIMVAWFLAKATGEQEKLGVQEKVCQVPGWSVAGFHTLVVILLCPFVWLFSRLSLYDESSSVTCPMFGLVCARLWTIVAALRWCLC